MTVASVVLAACKLRSTEKAQYPVTVTRCFWQAPFLTA